MSIELAVAWAVRTLRFPQAVQDAVEMFEQAARDGHQATLLVSDQLAKDRKGWLARWTGSEVVVVELPPRHQAGLGLQPGAMCRHAERRADLSPRPLIQRLTLSDVVIDDAELVQADRPLIGSCGISFDGVPYEALDGCALRVEYFQPEVPRQITGYWHLNGPIRSGRAEYRFSLPALVTQNPSAGKQPPVVSGSLVLFLQMVSADDWRNLAGLRPLSNTTAALVEIQMLRGAPS